MTAPPVPYPTKTRLQLARGIAAGQVKHYPWPPPDKPLTVWLGGVVTARVRELVQAGLAAVRGTGTPDAAGWPVELTPAGRLWLHRYTPPAVKGPRE